jgi:hypothetical protein
MYSGCTDDNRGGVTVGVLTEEQLRQIWDDQGLEHRMRRFYGYLADRGLLQMSVPEDIFLIHIRDDILKKFFVQGTKELADGRQQTTDGD